LETGDAPEFRESGLPIFSTCSRPWPLLQKGAVMILIAIILTLAAGVFYGAGVNNAAWADQVCRYGDGFCTHPSWLGVPALLSIIWALFLRVDRL
jgi:hypothetical protein